MLVLSFEVRLTQCPVLRPCHPVVRNLGSGVTSAEARLLPPLLLSWSHYSASACAGVSPRPWDSKVSDFMELSEERQTVNT